MGIAHEVCQRMLASEDQNNLPMGLQHSWSWCGSESQSRQSESAPTSPSRQKLELNGRDSVEYLRMVAVVLVAWYFW